MARLYMILCIVTTCFTVYCSGQGQIFDENYRIDWGAEQITILNGRSEVQIKIDQKSGPFQLCFFILFVSRKIQHSNSLYHPGGGFKSKYAYSSGYFKTSLKIPKNSRGLTATFYVRIHNPFIHHWLVVLFLLINSSIIYAVNFDIKRRRPWRARFWVVGKQRSSLHIKH